MRLKNDHVTNSSSASFVVSKYWLNMAQIDMIKHHIQIASHLPNQEVDFPWLHEWNIEETEAEVRGRTTMDNFDMYKYLREVVGVPEEHINYDGGG